jgi:cell shape-determining protein MreD
MINYLYYSILSFGLVLIQQSVLSALGVFSDLNLLLVFLVFVTIIWGFNLGFIFAVFIGLFLSIYSFLPLGSFIIIFLLVILLINFLYKNIFINLSFNTSLILILLSTFFYFIFIVLFSFLFYFLNLSEMYLPFDRLLLDSFIRQIILNLSLMALIFIIAKFSYKRLNLAFLIKK